MDIFELPTTDTRVMELIAAHHSYCREHTPAGSGHAVATPAETINRIRYWLAVEASQSLGCVGLETLNQGHAEIKTLHVLEGARHQGVGRALLENLMQAARSDGVQRLSLETGKSEGFAASRRLYERLGFAPCPAFGAYVDDPFSYCMTRAL